MSRVSIRFSDDEDIILTAYCKKHRRTKNDLIREYVRSLVSAEAPKSEQEFSSEWVENEYDGRIEGRYSDCQVKLYPDANGYEGFICPPSTNNPEEWISVDLFGHDSSAAIAKVKALIDNKLD